MLKSKIPVLRVGGSWNFDAEFKSAKIQNFHVEGEWEGGWGLWNFDAEFEFAKIQIPMLRGRGGTRGILMLSSNLLKSKIPVLRVGGSWNFDAEFKFTKIQNSHVEGGGALVEF